MWFYKYESKWWYIKWSGHVKGIFLYLTRQCRAFKIDQLINWPIIDTQSDLSRFPDQPTYTSRQFFINNVRPQHHTHHIFWKCQFFPLLQGSGVKKYTTTACSQKRAHQMHTEKICAKQMHANEVYFWFLN